MSSVADTQVAETISIDGRNLSLDDVWRVAFDPVEVSLSEEAHTRIERSRSVVDDLLERREVVYGITTGFGKFKEVFIPPEDSLRLQRNFLLSHSCGVGPAFERPFVRAITLLRANALAKGLSGVRTLVVQSLIDLLNKRVHPVIPEKGSVGASGDLAPLAHLALTLIGEGEAETGGKVMKSGKALEKAGLQAIDILAKEGLALTNGTQVMTAVGALVVKEAELLAKTADIVGSMTLEALLGSDRAFSEEIHQARPHPGQLASALNLRALLEQSELIKSHEHCDMVQDAYSIRCMPQVHGASRHALIHARHVLEIELNSATDNPLVFDEAVISGGNFHGQPIALVMDYVSIALSELANISERRTERLVNPALSNGLPSFLTVNGGLNSGFMIAQYSAAALVSENKSLAHPASVDSIPTSANQEDHVSMGTISSRKARDILANLKHVLAIELLCALQALDLRTGRNQGREAQSYSPDGIETLGKEPGIGVRVAYESARSELSFLKEDRILQRDVARAVELIESGELLKRVEEVVGQLA